MGLCDGQQTADVHLASICGGTDIVSCFVGGNPNAPVFAGEIQCKGLGMDVSIFDEVGNSIKENGEGSWREGPRESI